MAAEAATIRACRGRAARWDRTGALQHLQAFFDLRQELVARRLPRGGVRDEVVLDLASRGLLDADELRIDRGPIDDRECVVAGTVFRVEPEGQKSRRTPIWPVRLPEFSADCTVVNFPNSGELMEVAGDRKLGWFGRLVKVPSSRRRRRSVA